MRTVLIPMAGQGSRFAAAGVKIHKPLIKVERKTLIELSIESLQLIGWQYVIVARDFGSEYRESLHLLLPFVEFVWVKELTRGAAETCLHAKHLINPDSELIVTNCDQYLQWNPYRFLEAARSFQAAILTYRSTDPKNSFARIHGGHVVDIVEKTPISDKALVGVHWYEKSKFFFDSAEAHIERGMTESREFYVSETLNNLIDKGMKVGAIDIEGGNYWSLGTPDDLVRFKGFYFENVLYKPKTYFIDLDGTLLLHKHRYDKLEDAPSLSPGVREVLNEMDSRGDKIILVSARKESARALTENTLRNLGVPYDQLILGVSQGVRILVNDVATVDSPPRAIARNIVLNKGFGYEDFE